MICRYVEMFAYKWLMLPALKSVGVWELQGKMIKYQFVYWLCLSRYISKYKNYVPISCISQHTTDRVMEKMKKQLYYFFSEPLNICCMYLILFYFFLERKRMSRSIWSFWRRESKELKFISNHDNILQILW